MTNFKKITTAIATTAVLLSSVAPALATDVTVTGNGAFSENGVSMTSTTTTSVTQNNTANISNNIDSDSSTGGNDASFNTGGQTTIDTGDASSNVEVVNAVNVNKAEVDACGCSGGSVDVTIDGNGAFSTNGVAVNKSNTTTLSQNNDADIDNDIDADAKTGYNDAGFNTGGDTSIMTGDASSSVSVSTLANANLAQVGGSGLGVVGGSSIIISGNGAFSENGVSYDKSSVIALTQNNDADIDNDVDADARTGDNDAGFNTGGDVTIDTGDASTDVEVSNLVNFNSADVNCGCALSGTTLKIADNGAYSESGISANDVHVLAVAALNDADLDNDVDGDAKTGYNDAGFNTADSDGDPAVLTGDASSTTEVSNSGNVNIFDQGAGLDLPWDLELSFDLLGLWGGLWHMVA